MSTFICVLGLPLLSQILSVRARVCVSVGFPLLLFQILLSYDDIWLSYTNCVHPILSFFEIKLVKMMENITSAINHIDGD